MPEKVDPVDFLDSLTLEEINERLEEAEEERARLVESIDKKIASLKVLQRALDVKENGPKKRAKPKWSSDGSGSAGSGLARKPQTQSLLEEIGSEIDLYGAMNTAELARRLKTEYGKIHHALKNADQFKRDDNNNWHRA